MIQFIIQLFSTITNGFYYLFWTSYSIGKLISWIFSSVLNILLYFWTNIKEAGTIFSEDFIIFFKDLMEITSSILDAGKDSILSSGFFLYSIVRVTITTIMELFTTGNVHSVNVGQQCVNSFVTMMNALKNLFVLIGNGAWFMLAFVPTLLFTMFTYVYQLTHTLLQIFFNFVEDIWVYAKDISYASVNYFLDVPLQAIIGCGFIVLLLVYRRITQRFIVWLTIRALQYLRSRLLTAIFALFSIFTRRNNNNRPRPQPQFRSTLGNSRSSTTNQRLSPKNVKGSSTEENVCVICRDEQKNVVLMPCRHLCLCINCSGAVRTCPLCRKPITKIMSVYT